MLTANDSIKVGDGVTVLCWTDRHAYTVISVSPKGFKAQRDKVTRITKPEFIPGGFSGICTNNNEIKYEYEKDPSGHIISVRLRKNGFYQYGNQKLSSGRHEYYDYNF